MKRQGCQCKEKERQRKSPCSLPALPFKGGGGMHVCYEQFSYESRATITQTTCDLWDLLRQRQLDKVLKEVLSLVLCHINFTTFEDPVRTFEGHTFEKAAITKC